MPKTSDRVGDVKFKEFPDELYFFDVGQQTVTVKVQEEGDVDSQRAARGLITEIHKLLKNKRDE